MVVIAVKPHLYTEVLHKLAGEGRRLTSTLNLSISNIHDTIHPVIHIITTTTTRYGAKLWVSIMAGVVLADLTSAISLVTDSVQRVVRTIPNTPVKVQYVISKFLSYKE